MNTFIDEIKSILKESYPKISTQVYERSSLLKYIGIKTKSANRGSKSRGSFANLYALYVIIEDYLNNGFEKNSEYQNYEGAQYTNLLTRMRALPFGAKLQNHALNNRCNSEFKKYFPTENEPIIRNQETNRYWINENLLSFKIEGQNINIANVVTKIIDRYIEVKQDAFQRFIDTCLELKKIEEGEEGEEKVHDFIIGLLQPNVDARLFEIVSYSILKVYYKGQSIFWGYSIDDINEEFLKLYKTGRTNANDGGIDFVMKPLGRFFQVTETLDFKKYFLDIDKIEKYPITFVIKSTESVKELTKKLEEDALQTYVIKAIVQKYMSCIEEIINIPILTEHFNSIVKEGSISEVLDEVILQSKTEFNIDDEDEEEDE